MATPASPRPIQWMAAKLIVTLFAAGIVFLLFTVFNHEFLNRLNSTEVLLLEAVAVVLIAYAVAAAVTTASNEILARRGLTGRSGAVRLFLNLLIGVAVVLGLFHLAGVSAESIFLGSAFAGIVLGLAAQTVLSNVFAGLLLVIADPFRLGDRVSFVTSSYPVLPPSYPHELTYPTYSGVILDIGLIYTMVRLETGAEAHVPNAIVLTSMLLKPGRMSADVHRVRMTFPITVPVATVEAALPAVAAEFPAPLEGAPQPRFEIADLSAASWDGVFVIWARGLLESNVRDRVLRAVLPQLASALGAK